MKFKQKIKFISLSSTHTIGIGFFLSRFINPGSCIMLDGEMASGKTTLVKGVAHGLMVKKAAYVDSPTYSLINKYYGTHCLYHIDLYRLNCCNDFFGLGLNEIINSDSLCIVEWSKKINSNELPGKTIQISFFKISKNRRIININLYSV